MNTTRSTLSTVALSLVLASAVTGCAEGTDVDVIAEDVHDAAPLAGCEELDVAVCDVREAACQRSLFELAACLRGDDGGTLPPVKLITREAYRDLIEEDLSGREFPDPDHWEVMLHWLGLVEPGAFSPDGIVDFQTSFPVAVYGSNDKQVLLIDFDPEGEITPASVVADAILIHEFVHALQDQQANLGALHRARAATYDGYLGLTSIIEGEARLLEQLAMAALNGVPPEDIDWPRAFETRIQRAEEALAEEPSPYLASRGIFAYDYGARFVYRVRERGGPAGARALFEAPPTSALPAMRSVDVLGSLEVPEAVFDPPAPPLGVELAEESVLGPWGVWLALRAQGRSRGEARAIALAWRGDHLRGYADSDGRTTMLWELELADTTMADRVKSALQLPDGTSSDVQREGTRVLLRVTNDPAGLGDWSR